MANDTEKLTINLGVAELAQIDVLTEQGLIPIAQTLSERRCESI